MYIKKRKQFSNKKEHTYCIKNLFSFNYIKMLICKQIVNNVDLNSIFSIKNYSI